MSNMIGWNTKYHEIVAVGKKLPGVKEIISMILTITLVVTGWIIFRAENTDQLIGYFHAMAINHFTGPELKIFYIPIVAIVVLLLTEWMTRSKLHALEFSTKGLFRYRAVRWAAYYVLVLAIYRSWGYAQDFIYFQF